MTSLSRIRLFALAAAGWLAFSVPSFVSAGDISLPKFSKDSELAAFHSAADIDATGRLSEDTMLTEILSISEVDVWGRIRTGFGIPDLQNPLVENHMNYYSKRPDYFNRTTQRASKYLFHIVQELEKRNMPSELALLPFIESSFNPHARSIAQAEGLWQFIPSTGRHYDLAQNAFRDERRNVLASTDAALTYLQNLYNMFGDWHLALAAYNWGEGSVMRAIRKAEAAGRPINFNSISAYMPAETRNYVPKLQAVKNLVMNPGARGLTLPPIENQPYFVTIGKTRDIDVSVAAKLAEMSIEDFRALNPQFGSYVITGGNEVKLLMPKENAEKFRRNLSRWSRPLSSWTAYQVNTPRERIEDIASRFNTSPDILRQVNHIPRGTLLKMGSAILVPKSSGNEADIAPELANAQMAVERMPSPRFGHSGKKSKYTRYAHHYQLAGLTQHGRHDKKSAGHQADHFDPYSSDSSASRKGKGRVLRLADVKPTRGSKPGRVKVVYNPKSSKKAASGAKNSAQQKKTDKKQASAKKTNTKNSVTKKQKKS